MSGNILHIGQPGKSYSPGSQRAAYAKIERAVNELSRRLVNTQGAVNRISRQITQRQESAGSGRLQPLGFVQWSEYTDEFDAKFVRGRLVFTQGWLRIENVQYRHANTSEGGNIPFDEPWVDWNGVSSAMTFVEDETFRGGGYYQFDKAMPIVKTGSKNSNFTVEIQALDAYGNVWITASQAFDPDKEAELDNLVIAAGNWNESAGTWEVFASGSGDLDTKSIAFAVQEDSDWGPDDELGNGDFTVVHNLPSATDKNFSLVSLGTFSPSTEGSPKVVFVVARAYDAIDKGGTAELPPYNRKQIDIPFNPFDPDIIDLGEIEAGKLADTAKRASIQIEGRHKPSFEYTVVQYRGKISYAGDVSPYLLNGDGTSWGDLDPVTDNALYYVFFDPTTWVGEGSGTPATQLQLTTDSTIAQSVSGKRLQVGVMRTTGAAVERAFYVFSGDQPALSAPFIYAAKLSSLSANLGEITAGSIEVGTSNKMWFNVGGSGAFAIGGTDPNTAPFRVAADGTLTSTLGSVQAVVDDVSGLTTQVTTNSTNITQNANAIALKANQTTVDGIQTQVTTLDGSLATLAGRVTTAEASIVVNANAIALKAAQTTVDGIDTRLTTAEGTIVTIDGRVTTAEASIVVNASAIALKASQTEVDGIQTTITGLDGDITTLEGRVTTAEASIVVNAGNIALKASQAALDTLSGTVSTNTSAISVNASNIALKVNASGVIAAINVSAEGVAIDGAKLHVTSATLFDNDVTINGTLNGVGGTFTGALSGGTININSGAFSVDASGNLFAQSGTFRGNVVSADGSTTLVSTSGYGSFSLGPWGVLSGTGNPLSLPGTVSLQANTAGAFAANLSLGGVSVSIASGAGPSLTVGGSDPLTGLFSAVVSSSIVSEFLGSFTARRSGLATSGNTLRDSNSYALEAAYWDGAEEQLVFSSIYLDVQSTTPTWTLRLGNVFTSNQAGQTSVGTVTSGTWQGTAINSAYIGSHNHAASDINSGTFDAARIPNLDAGKVTTGTFAVARIPSLSATYLTVSAGSSAPTSVNEVELDQGGVDGATRYRSRTLTLSNGQVTAAGTWSSWTTVIGGPAP